VCWARRCSRARRMRTGPSLKMWGGCLGGSFNSLELLSAAQSSMCCLYPLTWGHLRWKVDYSPSQPVGSRFEPHWRPLLAKLPSFGGYSLETLPYPTYTLSGELRNLRHVTAFLASLEQMGFLKRGDACASMLQQIWLTHSCANPHRLPTLWVTVVRPMKRSSKKLWFLPRHTHILWSSTLSRSVPPHSACHGWGIHAFNVIFSLSFVHRCRCLDSGILGHPSERPSRLWMEDPYGKQWRRNPVEDHLSG